MASSSVLNLPTDRTGPKIWNFYQETRIIWCSMYLLLLWPEKGYKMLGLDATRSQNTNESQFSCWNGCLWILRNAQRRLVVYPFIRLDTPTSRINIITFPLPLRPSHDSLSTLLFPSFDIAPNTIILCFGHLACTRLSSPWLTCRKQSDVQADRRQCFHPDHPQLPGPWPLQQGFPGTCRK